MARTKNINALEADIEKQAKELMVQFYGFTEGTRYLSLLHRSKDGGDQNSEYKRRAAHFVTHNAHEYENALVRLLILKSVSSTPYRLYASANARDIKKAERAFKRDMLEVDFEAGENKEYFWKRLESKWISALMQPGSRAGSGFMIDVDRVEGGPADITAPVLTWLAANKIEPLKQYTTPNGWHILTPPFNPTGWDVPNAEIKKDGLILLAA